MQANSKMLIYCDILAYIGESMAVVRRLIGLFLILVMLGSIVSPAMAKKKLSVNAKK
ncbi:MAG: hypothetical protein NZ872_02285 [Archaeoglobaceae archaeon]|nr:hypothetical protein [Archaeoglobaceae archaeon]MDW8128027.1 hypothetical protein [Archaeoglobaceae archaeon]